MSSRLRQGLVLILLIAMYKRIKLVVALFREASRVMANMPLLLFTPLTVRDVMC